MITDHVQRWKHRRGIYQRPADPIDTTAYEVAPIDGDGADRIAREFVETHHYSASYPAARERIGLYRARHAWAVGGGELVGVAVFSHPAQDRVLDSLPCDRAEAVELGRLVLLEDVPGNGETWFIARCFAELRKRGYAGVVSFADPVARSTAGGEVVFPGHVGTIYQASNAVFAGRASPRTLRLLPDGRVLSARTISKVRAREKGWRYAVDQLVDAGAAPPPALTADSLRAWLAGEVGRVTRPLRHHGNYKYLFGLTPACRRRLPASLPYPKVRVA